MKRYGVCKCGKWGEAPNTFHKAKHFMKCECGELMYLDIHNPREAGYQEKYNITDRIILVKI